MITTKFQDLFRENVVFVIGGDPKVNARKTFDYLKLLNPSESEDFIKVLEKQFSDYSVGGRFFDLVSGDSKPSLYIIYLPKWNPWAATHECVHCANSILKHKGVITTYDNDETLCYLVEWLFKNLEQFSKRKK
jgi:hypothetical protein